jgi:Mrp family chromosome partitioning ATPase
MDNIVKALDRARAQRRGVAGAPAAGAVSTPPVRALELDPRQRERERILGPDAEGPQGAAYKLLRTQVLRRLDKLQANTIGIFSPGPAEGKTLTAINLAIAIAACSDRNALLVDLDLRRPSVQRRFGFDLPIGVEHCLQQGVAVHEAMLRVTHYERLRLLPATASLATSSELLGSAACSRLIGELKARYANRIVIVDLPPVLHADDALAVLHQLQAGLVVVSEGVTRREDLVRTMSLLAELPIVGVLLNAARRASSADFAVRYRTDG